jgi:catechol 2,3-dioxygenase-like lactoylglutathione lyase family enzyme
MASPSLESSRQRRSVDSRRLSEEKLENAGCPRVLQIGFTSADAAAARDFYGCFLGFEAGESQVLQPGAYSRLIGLPGATVRLQRLQLGQECLEISEILDLGPGGRPGRPIPADSRSCDLWFQHICLVTSDLDQALARLGPALESGAARAVSRAPQTLPEWNTAAAGIRAFKFRDPEGHNLELLQFPPGKGEARWHGAAAGPMTPLGIDHSALAVADSRRSCRFYDELLGLRLGGDGVNSGSTQDDLDGLTDTRVRITSHRCPTGAGVECLDYQLPNRGRPMPADLSAIDPAHWQIRLAVADLNAIAARLESSGGRILSDGIVELGEAEAKALGFRRGLQVADPDGHRLQLVETA